MMKTTMSLLLLRLGTGAVLLALVSSYTANNNKPVSSSSSSSKLLFGVVSKPLPSSSSTPATAAITAAGLALGLLLSTSSEPAYAATSSSSKTAAQISLNSLPPTSISVQIQDLPVVGNLLSGTYTKIDSLPAAGTGAASVTISSPKDKIAAIKSVLTGGHLEFDVNGLLTTHLDVDIAADQAGVATVRVASPLIPTLPFHNAASTTSSPVVASSSALAATTTTTPATTTTTSGKPSEWSSVTNLGSGATYYFNEKTGVTQYERPNKI